MSATARSTPRGGKSSKVEVTTPKTQKSDVNKTESPKTVGLDKSQVPTAEQMRMAEIMETKKDDLALKDKIKQVMDATQKTEDEVCTALHDCDNDANRAVNYLLEGTPKNEWSTSVIKKKKRTTGSNKSDTTMNNHVGGSVEGEDWDQPQGVEVNAPSSVGRGRDRPRQRGGGPPRLRGRGSSDSRPWRTRENKENERNLEDMYSGERGGGRRGDRGGRMSNGPGRGGRGGRGGGRLGSRTFQSRDKPSSGFSQSIETWNPSDDTSGGKMESWTADDGFPSPEDWDNEEYTGSLADSKVFTPSSGPEPVVSQPPVALDTVENSLPEQASPIDLQPAVRPTQLPPNSVMGNTLTPAQTQYLTQLTQQSSESFKATNSGVPGFTQQSQPTSPQQYPQQYPPPASSVPYSTTYGVTANSYSSSLPEGNTNLSSQTLPPRTKVQKPRVPPPSKIPSSAVEMPPGDAIAVALLDVQFGGLEFGSDSSTLETSTTIDSTNTTTSVPSSAPTSTSSIPTTTSVSASVASIMESYAAAVPNSAQQQANLANALAAQTQKLTSSESILPTQSDLAAVSQAAASYVATQSAATRSATSVLSELSNSTPKTETSQLAYNSADGTLYQPQQTYQKTSTGSTTANATSYTTPVSTYNSSSYSTSQVTSSNTGYSSQTTGYTNSNSAGGYGSSSSVSTPSVNSYPSYSVSQASYAYPSYPAVNSYQTASTGQTYPPQSYQGSVAAAGVSYPYQNSSYPQSAVHQNHKMNVTLGSTQSKDSQYETGQVTNNSIPAVSTVNSTPSLGLSATSQSVATSKVTALSTANKSGIVAGIPPQVPPMINTQYIMSQAAGLPYFQQPVFSYDDALMMQQRLAAAAPPMATGYFDMGFQQQPTSLGTGRDASLGNVPYSMSDGRFARADNNASPVPSTQNVNQGHQQPMLNPTGLPPGYTYIYGSFPNFQYGTPTALYPMAPTAAAGNTTSGQYKGPGYGTAAGYSSGYEASADGYKVGSGTGYSASPAQTKAGTPTTSTDLYTKGHATLNKVNSYDKAGFHSGTPPPFNLTGSQSGLAPSGTYTPHLFISTLPPHQQHTHSAATLMHSHQPLHQDGTSNSGPRSQAASQPTKAGAKQQNYSPSFWANTS